MNHCGIRTSPRCFRSQFAVSVDGVGGGSFPLLPLLLLRVDDHWLKRERSRKGRREKGEGEGGERKEDETAVGQKRWWGREGVGNQAICGHATLAGVATWKKETCFIIWANANITKLFMEEKCKGISAWISSRV